jgi:hypothetical protein
MMESSFDWLGIAPEPAAILRSTSITLVPLIIMTHGSDAATALSSKFMN